MADMGAFENPFTHAPEKWDSEGVEYGSYCKCHKCGLVSRSTFSFDYYADNVGDPLSCERCALNSPMSPVIADAVAKKILEDEKKE